MVTARRVISNSLAFGLNRLAPGETLDADTALRCLDALNHVLDGLVGGRSTMWQAVSTQSAPITGQYGTLGTEWATLPGGVQILQASIAYPGADDQPLGRLSAEAYFAIPDKAQTGTPRAYWPDGFGRVYLWPAATGQRIKLRTMQAAALFVDLDTEYDMPLGWQSALTALLTETLAPTLGGVTPGIAREAARARVRLAAMAENPGTIRGAAPAGNILVGWQ